MALGLSITGILAIVVVVLALVIILLGMTGRVRKLNTQLKTTEEDNITPYLRTVIHYKKSDFTDESKLNALNKISKQFFRDLLHFSSEKTFDEIGSLSQDSDIKTFCSSMSIIRYSKTIRKSDVDSLYRSFENLLVKRRPISAVVLNDNSSQNNKPMTIDDLNNRKVKKDIVDIKNELDKMKIQEPLTPSQAPFVPNQPSAIVPPSRPVIVQNNNNSQSSLVKFSIDEKLSEMEEEIDKESVHDNNSISTMSDNQSNVSSEMTNQNVHHDKIVRVNPNKVISGLVRGVPVESMKPQRVSNSSHISKRILDSVSPSQARINIRDSGKKLSFDKFRVGNDEPLSREITNLNSRIQKLLDVETNRQLTDVEQGRY